MEETTDLVQRPYLDRLMTIQAKKNEEKQAIKARKKDDKKREKLERYKMQSYWQVELFLKTKCPDAYSEGDLASVPPKEFDNLLKKARGWLWKKTAGHCFYFIASFSIPVIPFLIMFFAGENALTAVLVVLSIMATLVGATFSFIDIIHFIRFLVGRGKRIEYLSAAQYEGEVNNNPV